MEDKKRRQVSVIIVNYNNKNYLLSCIQTVLNNEVDKEVILVDNGSTDGSLQEAEEKFGSQLSAVVRNGNIGYAGGINSALNITKGKYIAPLNADTVVSHDWLEIMLSYMESRDKVGAVTPLILIASGKMMGKVNAMGGSTHISGFNFCRNLYQRVDVTQLAHSVPSVSGCSYLVRKEILDRIGGVPDFYPMSADDVALSWMVRLMGYDIYCVPSSVVYHDWQLQMSSRKFEAIENNRHAMLGMLDSSTLVVLSPVLLLMEILVTMYAMTKGYMKARNRTLAEMSNAMWLGNQYRKYKTVNDWKTLKAMRLNLEWNQLLKV